MPIPASSASRLARSFAAALIVGASSGLAMAAPGDDVDPLAALMADTAAAITPSSAEATTTAEPSLLRQVHDKAATMAVSAMNFIGVHYRRGGQSAETGFDCSGFTRHVFEMSGLVLPRRADEQAADKKLVAVKREDLKPGDLVFFNTMRRTFSHVAIYIGDNRFIHAPSHGKNVRTDDLGFAYWAKRFTGARRAESLGDVASSSAAGEGATAASPAATPLPSAQ
jgi:cell wall-associated NlpC family hydrolase